MTVNARSARCRRIRSTFYSMAPNVLSGRTNSSADRSIGSSFSNREFVTVGIILACFLAVCISIQSRYIPWGDEVQFVDPAANLYYKLGFVSTEWSNQTAQTFWSGNAPAYPVLLYFAFRTFHFSQTVARSLNYIIMAVAVLLLWIGVLRARLLLESRTRLLMLALVLTGHSCYVCYGNIRYDCLSFLECSLAFLAYTLKKPALRHACLFSIGTIMVLTNLQLPQYVVALMLLVTYAYSLKFHLLWALRFMYLGFGAGGMGLLVLYASHRGSFAAFLVTLQQQAGERLRDKLHNLHYYFEYDASLIAIFVLLLVAFAIVSSHPNANARRSIVAGLLICVVLPAFFFLVRRFVFSSAWMVYVPAVVCVCQVFEARISASRAWKALAVMCCIASMTFGLPKALTGTMNEWSLRNYAVVDAFVIKNIGTEDTVFCDAEAYFAAKPLAAKVFGPAYLTVMSAQEKKAITVVIVSASDQAEVVGRLGGHWTITEQLVRDNKSSTEKLFPISSNFNCRLNVLRRQEWGSGKN